MTKSGSGDESIAAELARLFTQANTVANRAGRALHDDVGPLLSAAGLHLQLLQLDHPATAAEVDRISSILDQAYERLREVSQSLSPSPVLRGGLRNALERLTETTGSGNPSLSISLRYDLEVNLPTEVSCAMYDGAAAAVSAALDAVAGKIAIAVRGKRGAELRVSDDGRRTGRGKRLTIAKKVASANGLLMTVTTKQSTIVSIRYAL